mmetsp:Transcript_415/g.1043  ORF Transcript_415/g.1043 Transcript_415/m.1043 type:complete len:204 (+) Transcript_415:96-707(+)
MSEKSSPRRCLTLRALSCPILVCSSGMASPKTWWLHTRSSSITLAAASEHSCPESFIDGLSWAISFGTRARSRSILRSKGIGYWSRGRYWSRKLGPKSASRRLVAAVCAAQSKWQQTWPATARAAAGRKLSTCTRWSIGSNCSSGAFLAVSTREMTALRPSRARVRSFMCSAERLSGSSVAIACQLAARRSKQALCPLSWWPD